MGGFFCSKAGEPAGSGTPRGERVVLLKQYFKCLFSRVLLALL